MSHKRPVPSEHLVSVEHHVERLEAARRPVVAQHPVAAKRPDAAKCHDAAKRPDAAKCPDAGERPLSSESPEAAGLPIVLEPFQVSSALQLRISLLLLWTQHSNLCNKSWIISFIFYRNLQCRQPLNQI